METDVVGAGSAGRGRVTGRGHRGLIVVLTSGVTLLAVVSLVTTLASARLPSGLVAFLDTGTEQNAPTFVNVVLLLAVAVTAALAGVLGRNASPRVARATQVWWWTAAAVLFAASFDEATGVHEAVGRAIRPTVQSLLDGRGGALATTTWLLPGIVLGACLLAAAVLGWRHAPVRTRAGLLSGFAILLGGAVGFEVLGDREYERTGERTTRYHALSTVEELLEMLGSVVMLDAVLRSVRVERRHGGLHLAYAAPADATSPAVAPRAG